MLLACAGGAAACSSDGGPAAASGSAGSAGAGGLPQAGSSAGGSGGTAGGANASAGTAGGGQTPSTAGSAGVGSGGTPGTAGTSGAGDTAGAGGAVVQPGLVATPSELVFGAVQKTASGPQTVMLTNPSAQAVQLMSTTLDAAAADTPMFELVSGPQAGTQIAAGNSTTVQLRFHPGSVATFKSKLVVQTANPAAKLEIGLYGLGTKGLEGENEPFLKPVLDTLGFNIDVGGAGLLSTTTPLVGSEVAAPRFKAASAAEVELVPVARYSPQEPIPYGYYSGASATETQVGIIADDQYQALNPKTDAGSKKSFAAPTGEFGIFTTSKTHKTYTEDAKNAGNATKHAVRTYPLKDRAGAAIPNGYLVCFEEAANGDYQDYVFTLRNVTPVAP